MAREREVAIFGPGMKAQIANHTFELLPQKALFWPAHQILLIADLHLGKINHFRKSGYPVPPRANDVNTELLIELMSTYKPVRTLFLGDLFHSHYNEEWEVLGQVRRHFASCSFELVLGNHDIMSELQYQRHQMSVHTDLQIENVWLTHEPQQDIPTGTYNLAGHLHPGARLVGGGKQALTLPCFYFGKQQGILPAFGSFTGLYRVPVKKEDQVFVIADNQVIRVC